jgi:8-oxo-dGTP pyrophosphatase MutT (NUDIX family)
MLSETFIRAHLKDAYRPGQVASSDLISGREEGSQLKCAAVLIPLVRWKQEWQLVFTRRTETVEHHKGQVAFPGGGCELGESTPEKTALREAWEEIGLKPQDVHILGRLNDIITITHFRVTPVVGVVPWPYQVDLQPAEVGRIFTIPLAWLVERTHWTELPVTPTGAPHPFPVIRYQPYDGEVLWGITARITHNFLSVLELDDKVSPSAGDDPTADGHVD